MKYKITIEVDTDKNKLSSLLWALRAFFQERHKVNHKNQNGYITNSCITYEELEVTT
jgi:hypothetical protein